MSSIHERVELPNGRHVDVNELTYGRARVCLINQRDRFSYDDEW